MRTDATHDPGVTSWVAGANRPGTDFPVQNLPFGVARRRGGADPFRIAVAIGDAVLDLGACAEQGVLADVDEPTRRACAAPRLNALMALPPASVTALRRAVHETLRADATPARRAAAERCLVPMTAVELTLPAQIGNYTDFFASIHHATRVGALFRPANPLAANYKHIPVAYIGRASTVVPSGTPITRPRGQISNGKEPPIFAPTRHLDFELEVGFFIGQGNALGSPIPIGEAHRHIFGACLLNDWSARDFQWWESQPLGPFLSKSFATTISPWVVTADALAPYRAPAVPRSGDDPRPLPYLWSDDDQAGGLFGIDLEAELLGEVVARTNLDTMYWTPAQMIAHHTANGCNLMPGDLLGCGTASGPAAGSEACLLERTRNGREPIAVAGQTRTFLENGDEVVLRGRCSKPGAATIGFGDCRGVIIEE